MSELKVNAITDASGGTTASINGYTPTASNMAGKNRIINSAMMIDQRNAGASSNPDNTYGIDRWYGRQVGGGVFSMQQSSTVPAGFQYSMALTVTTADASLVTTDRYIVQQRIEGYNVADLNWGTSDAKTITVSFWARSSITGNHSISVKNQASNRIYATTYSISSADTWEYKTITIAGDQSGTWEKTTSIGIALTFGLGGGPTYTVPANNTWTAGDYLFATGAVNLISTNSATLYITGVQLEIGSAASQFSLAGGGQYGAELALCQRYYEVMNSPGADLFLWNIEADNAGGYRRGTYYYRTEKRAAATITQTWSGTPGTSRGVQLNETYACGAYVNGIGSSAYASLYKIQADAEL